MIPISLSITGFGPYRESQTIDFTSMGEAPLFLINGPTGAGKTTILDAICYALYDRATWKSRDVKDMRCHHCTPADKTIVSFDFAARGEVFRVVREPEYLRRALKKKDGDEDSVAVNQKQAMIYKVTRENGEEALEPLVKRKGKVTDKVVEILGLDAEQFCQVIVLPQGMTRELLTEKSSERERVYEKLFATSIYVAIEKELKQRKDEIDRQTSTLTQRGTDLLEKAEVSTPEELSSLVDELNAAQVAATAERDRLQDLMEQVSKEKTKAEEINRAFDEIEKAEARLAQLGGQQAHIDRLVTALEKHDLADPLKPLHEFYTRALTAMPGVEQETQTASDEESRLTDELKVAKANDQLAKDNAAGRDELLKRRSELEGVLASLDELESAATVLKQATTTAATAKTHLESVETTIAALSERLQGEEQDVKDREENLKDAPNFEARSLELEGIESLQKAADAAKTEFEAAERQLGEAETAHRTAAATYEEDNNAYLKLQQKWHLGQAAVLAEQLEDGAPCPVCGSEDHPSPAVGGEETVSGDELETAREAAETARAAVSAAEANTANATETLHKAKADQLAAIDALKAVDSEGLDVAQALADLEHQRKAHQTALSELQTATEAQDATKTELADAIAHRESAKEAKANADGAVEGHQANFNSLSARLPEGVEDAETLQTKIKELDQTIAGLDAGIDEAAKALDKVSREHASAVASAQAAARRAEEAKDKFKEAETNWLDALAASAFATAEDWRLALMSPDIVRQKRGEVSDHREAIAATEGGMKENRKIVEGNERKQDLNAIDELLRERQQAVADSARVLETAISDQAVMAERLAEYGNIREDLDKLNASFGPIDELYRLASGSASGRISLHRHIQGKLLDEVVARGNSHYRHMTNGRYSLKRRTVASGGGGHDGLALNIFDTQSATERSVSTLSGGESFQAQTALALGLSETVQAHAGGVQLETLFIDEGFGSLDADSLQLAIETLMELQASGRYVGVISHVDSMNAQIDTQIQVTSGKSGSQIAVIV